MLSRTAEGLRRRQRAPLHLDDHRLDRGRPSPSKLSAQSPVGRALLGRKVGESVAVQTPRGKRGYRVVRLVA
jgi:hypothetical protein